MSDETLNNPSEGEPKPSPLDEVLSIYRVWPGEEPVWSAEVGCLEWQTSITDVPLSEAQDWVEGWRKDNFTMGLYSATYAYITGPDDFRIEYETGYD